ncbi:MAG: hypothetical protein ACJ76A_04550, partial [Actinomycetota bacterium]
MSIVIGGSTAAQVDVVAENTAGCPQSQENPIPGMAAVSGGHVAFVTLATAIGFQASPAGCHSSEAPAVGCQRIGRPSTATAPVSVLARPESGSVCQVDVAGSKDSVW